MPWPSVYLLGVQKGATTSLSEAFTEAGMCTSKEGKELHFWDWLHPNDECLMTTTCAKFGVKYAKHFPECKGDGDGAFDGSPSQLSDPGLPEFLSRHMPPAMQSRSRFIIIAREPVSRLVSVYNHLGANGELFVDKYQREARQWHSGEEVWGKPVRTFFEDRWYSSTAAPTQGCRHPVPSCIS